MMHLLTMSKDDFPVRYIGTMELNRAVDEYFTVCPFMICRMTGALTL